MCGPGQVAKHMWVESLEPSKVNQEEAPISYQQPMACHPTKVVMHLELADVGDTKRGWNWMIFKTPRLKWDQTRYPCPI